MYMDSYNYAINIEKDNISIYKLGCGIVLSETNVAMTSKRQKGRVLNAGDNALRFVGKVDKDCSFVVPNNNGRISSINICAEMLDMLMSKVEDRGLIKRRNIVFLVPCGLSPKELDAYQGLGYNLSAKNTKLVTKVQGVSRLALNNKKLASMVLILAEDYLDVAIIYDEKIVKGYTIDFGGEVIMASIASYLNNNKSVEVDDKTLKTLKADMATILPNDIIEEKYYGKEIYSKEYVEFGLSSSEVREYYVNYISEVADIIDAIMKTLSKEILAELKVSGAVIVGKNAEITGLKKFLASRLGINIKIVDNPNYAALLGVGSALNDVTAITRLAIK